MVLLRTVVIARDRHTRALGFSGKEKRKKKRGKRERRKKKIATIYQLVLGLPNSAYLGKNRIFRRRQAHPVAPQPSSFYKKERGKKWEGSEKNLYLLFSSPFHRDRSRRTRLMYVCAAYPQGNIACVVAFILIDCAV